MLGVGPETVRTAICGWKAGKACPLLPGMVTTAPKAVPPAALVERANWMPFALSIQATFRVPLPSTTIVGKLALLAELLVRFVILKVCARATTEEKIKATHPANAIERKRHNPLTHLDISPPWGPDRRGLAASVKLCIGPQDHTRNNVDAGIRPTPDKP